MRGEKSVFSFFVVPPRPSNAISELSFTVVFFIVSRGFLKIVNWSAKESASLRSRDEDLSILRRFNRGESPTLLALRFKYGESDDFGLDSCKNMFGVKILTFERKVSTY